MRVGSTAGRAGRVVKRERRKLSVPPPMPVMMEARAKAADTSIEAGEQKLQVTLAVTYELQ